MVGHAQGHPVPVSPADGPSPSRTGSVTGKTPPWAHSSLPGLFLHRLTKSVPRTRQAGIETKNTDRKPRRPRAERTRPSSILQSAAGPRTHGPGRRPAAPHPRSEAHWGPFHACWAAGKETARVQGPPRTLRGTRRKPPGVGRRRPAGALASRTDSCLDQREVQLVPQHRWLRVLLKPSRLRPRSSGPLWSPPHKSHREGPRLPQPLTWEGLKSKGKREAAPSPGNTLAHWGIATN